MTFIMDIGPAETVPPHHVQTLAIGNPHTITTLARILGMVMVMVVPTMALIIGTPILRVIAKKPLIVS